MKKLIISILVLAVLGVAIYALAPFYAKRVMTMVFADIEDYQAFDNDTLQTTAPSTWPKADEYNQKKLSEEMQDFMKKRQTKAFVVIQDGKILHEQYWDDYTPATISASFSMAKSVISLLIGKALEEGKITSLDQKVSEILPQYSFVKDGKVLTIKDLLTMSAGFDWSENYYNPFNITTEAYYGNDIHATLSKLKMKEKPGVHWEYQSISTQVLGEILVKATGKSVTEYATEILWIPLQMEHQALWSLDRPKGMEKAFCCLTATARDFARLGQMVLNNGKKDSTQIIPEAYVKAAISPAEGLKNPDNSPVKHYGYQFWIMHYKDLTVPYFCGHLGQFIFVIPEKNAIVVRVGADVSNKTDKEEQYLDGYTFLQAGLDILK